MANIDVESTKEHYRIAILLSPDILDSLFASIENINGECLQKVYLTVLNDLVKCL